ncbi:MAG: type VI secretion system baseplate subunit TssE [Planctomycetota bacterium]
MAELTPQERLQPSLLDRLLDDEPDKTQEPRERRVLSVRQMRAGVLRDLVWLLNTTNLAATPKADQTNELDHYPDVRSSVLNYGMPDLAGRTLSGSDPVAIEAALKRVLLNFEPRLVPRTLNVRVHVAHGDMGRNAMMIEIEGELWAQPLSERVFLKTQLDLETGNISLEDHTGRGAS